MRTVVVVVGPIFVVVWRPRIVRTFVITLRIIRIVFVVGCGVVTVVLVPWLVCLVVMVF